MSKTTMGRKDCDYFHYNLHYSNVIEIYNIIFEANFVLGHHLNLINSYSVNLYTKETFLYASF